MFLKLQPLIYATLFFAGLELIIAMPAFVYWILAALIAMALFQSRKIGGAWSFSILPVFFTLSSAALLYLITLYYEQQIFILFAAGMYYLSLLGAYRLGKYAQDRTAKAMNMAATAATIFFAYAGAYGIYLNFLIPLSHLMLFYLLVTLLVSYQYFAIIRNESKKTVWIYSFLIALIMAEIIWTMNFWPFGYLTTGVIALILYYVLWDLTQGYLLDELSRRRVVANLIFLSMLVVLVLLSSKWIPVM